MICKFCQKEFHSKDHPNRIRKFCSRLCDSKSIVSEETCRKISKANKGRPSPVKGMKFGPHTEEWKKMMSERMKGVPRTEEIKKKISKSHLGIKPSVDTRKKMSERRKGRPHWNKGGVAPWFVGDKNPAWIGGESSYIIRELKKNAPRPKPNKCEICGLTKRIYLDHNHETGKFRGWLCINCNLILGHAKDNPELLIKLAEYLKRFSA